jgi:hypothetical protein
MNMKIFLAMVFAFFVAMMIAVYLGAKQADPVLLDEHGKPVAPANR